MRLVFRPFLGIPELYLDGQQELIHLVFMCSPFHCVDLMKMKPHFEDNYATFRQVYTGKKNSHNIETTIKWIHQYTIRLLVLM